MSYDRLEALKAEISSGKISPAQPASASVQTEPQAAAAPAAQTMETPPSASPSSYEETTAPVPAQEQPAAAPAGLSAEQRDAVLAVIRKKKLTLAASIDQAIGWRQSENSISFSFENGFQATVCEKRTEV